MKEKKIYLYIYRKKSFSFFTWGRFFVLCKRTGQFRAHVTSLRGATPYRTIYTLVVVLFRPTISAAKKK